jgi:hypothetical protein
MLGGERGGNCVLASTQPWTKSGETGVGIEDVHVELWGIMLRTP